MIDSWIEKTFSTSSLTNSELASALVEMVNSKEAAEVSQTPQFLYSLAKVNTEAAFILWQMQKQKMLSYWVKIIRPSLDLTGVEIVTSHLFPVLNNSNILLLKNNQAYLFTKNDSALRTIEKPLSFRRLQWQEVKSFPERALFSFESNDVLKDEILSIAAIIAGAKYKAFKLAEDYASTRIQGGREIKDWSSIRLILSELFISVKVDEALMTFISVPTAHSILKDADLVLSQVLQVMGGAGYVEDYVVERLYRECIFLKNWPHAFRENLINYYQHQVRV